MKLATYDFEILYRLSKSNLTDAPSRRPDYKKEPPLDLILLPTL